jgi:hypothetical protein
LLYSFFGLETCLPRITRRRNEKLISPSGRIATRAHTVAGGGYAPAMPEEKSAAKTASGPIEKAPAEGDKKS